MGCAGLPGEAIGPGGPYQNFKEKLQEVFHVYLNKFEIAVSHLFLIIFRNNKFYIV